MLWGDVLARHPHNMHRITIEYVSGTEITLQEDDLAALAEQIAKQYTVYSLALQAQQKQMGDGPHVDIDSARETMDKVTKKFIIPTEE